jgi:hypothetical protein
LIRFHAEGNRPQMKHAASLAISVAVAACAVPPRATPVSAPPAAPTAMMPVDAPTSASSRPTLAPEANAAQAPAADAEGPKTPPDPRCERLRLENERQVREVEALLSDWPEENRIKLRTRLLEAVARCLPGRGVAWGLGFAWPPPKLPPRDVIPPRAMEMAAWSTPLLLQVVRVDDGGTMQRACVGASGPSACAPKVSRRAVHLDRMALPQLVLERQVEIERVVDIDGDGRDELVVSRGFCMYDCFTWLEIWSSTGAELVPFGPTAGMNLVGVDDYDGDGKVDVATRAGFAQVCHEIDSRDPVSKEVRVQDECFGPKKQSPALVRRNLGGGRFGPPGVAIETEVSGHPDPRIYFR